MDLSKEPRVQPLQHWQIQRPTPMPSLCPCHHLLETGSPSRFPLTLPIKEEGEVEKAAIILEIAKITTRAQVSRTKLVKSGRLLRVTSSLLHKEAGLDPTAPSNTTLKVNKTPFNHDGFQFCCCFFLAGSGSETPPMKHGKGKSSKKKKKSLRSAHLTNSSNGRKNNEK